MSTELSAAEAPAFGSRTSFMRSLAIQARVIHALLMREVITRFGRRNLGVLWLVAEPMMFTAGVATLWSLAGLKDHVQLPIVAFAISGYSSVLMWRNTVSRCNRAIGENFNLMYHRNVQVIDVFLARVLVEVGGATASFMLLSAGAAAFGLIDPPVDLLMIAFGWIMLCWFGMSLAFLIGSAVAYSEVIDRIWHPVSYLLFPLSGAAFMVDWLPPNAREVVLFLPMVHGVEMMREGFFGDVVRMHYDIAYMGTFNLVLTLAGLALMRGAARRLEEA